MTTGGATKGKASGKGQKAVQGKGQKAVQGKGQKAQKGGGAAKQTGGAKELNAYFKTMLDAKAAGAANFAYKGTQYVQATMKNGMKYYKKA